MAFRGICLFVFLLAAVAISGCNGGHRHRARYDKDDSGWNDWGVSRWDDDDNDDDDDDSSYEYDHKHDDHGWDWRASAGIGVLVVVIIVICGLLSLISWLSCHIYSKCRKDRVGVLKTGVGSPASPAWSANLIFKPELAAGFGPVSEGLLSLGPNHLLRTRVGSSGTDGAKWSFGMSKGKHVFEITWPWGQRGTYAGIGVGLQSAPIKANKMVPLVGSDATSWGLDIVKRRALHNNKHVRTCPTDGSYVPDKFLMYVDMDEGTLGFGNDVTYWGEVITDLPKEGTQPLYVMIGASQYQAEISINYKGSASDGANHYDKAGKPPHHLPPLYATSPPGPPSYAEFDEEKPPIMVMPPGPYPQPERNETPPPPYTRPPTGMGHEKA